MNNADIIATGDQLQSAASRMADWITQAGTPENVPYEVYMAALEAEAAIEIWTNERRRSSVQ